MQTNTSIEEARSAASQQAPKGPSKLVLLLVSVGFSLLLFLTLDWFHTRSVHRRAQAASVGPIDSCEVRDPVRHHVFKPNCSSTEYWGNDSYKLFTNSLGFRDEKIREVPLTDTRPRILLLGDSFTEGKLAWHRSFVGRIADHFPQYDFLNAGMSGYSPSNYLTTARTVLDKGVDIDEVIVFLDNSAVALEASFYEDTASGGVRGMERSEQGSAWTWHARLDGFIARNFMLTHHLVRLFDRFQRKLVVHGFYHLPGSYFGDPFDMEMSAWTYRKVNESVRFPGGYAPLGVEGGIAKQKIKMDLLWQELQKRNIPISVVMCPHLAQLVHDTPDNRQVQFFRQWCEGKCKRFISVLPAFYAEKQQCPLTQAGCWYPKLFVIGDIHLTAAGNVLVADDVVKSLTKEPAVKRDSGPETRLQ
jgi:hypothetical protein